MSENNFKEKLILKFKKNWIRNNAMTIFLVVILVTVFLLLNIWVQSLDLAQIDVTENKVYSLTDTTKNMLKNVDKEVKIYLFEYKENDIVTDLVKQYCNENEKITYEFLTEENNKEKYEKLGLQAGYPLVILEENETTTILDGYQDFTSYDYTTGQEVDLTEQAISNAILNLTVENKPKVYFLSGHGEFTLEEMGLFVTYLGNEAYEYEILNLLTVSQIPEDCSVLLIMSPTVDFLEEEINIVLDYINRGGNIIVTKDTDDSSKQYPNLQKVLDIYGISVENGYVYESNADSMLSGYPVIIIPEMSEYNEITSIIKTDGGSVVLPYAQKINKTEVENVESETILNSTANSRYINDISEDAYTAVLNSKIGSVDIAVLATKKINEIESKILVIGNGRFITDYALSSEGSPISYYRNNKDFMLNSVASLTNRKETLTIRKETNSSTYIPTAKQDIIVQIIIYGVPILIIITGIIVWTKRKKQR